MSSFNVLYFIAGVGLVRAAMLQLSRTSGFADMASITVQIAGDADRFGKDAKKVVRDAWKKVGL